MAFFDDILRNLQGQQGPSLGVNTQVPQPLPLQPAQPSPMAVAPEVRGAGDGLLGTLGLIASALKGDIGGVVSQLETKKLAKQTQNDKQKKLQTEQNISQLTGSALGTSKQDLGSPEQLFNAFSQAGASPEDARATLNFIQGQQENATRQAGQQAFAPVVAQNAQGLQDPVLREAILNAQKAGANDQQLSGLLDAALGRQTQASERAITKQDKALNAKQGVAKQTISELKGLNQVDNSLNIIASKLEAKGTTPLTSDALFKYDPTKNQDVIDFANKYTNDDLKAARLGLSSLQQKFSQNKGSFIEDILGNPRNVTFSPVDVKGSLDTAGSTKDVEALKQAKEVASQVPQEKAANRPVDSNTQLKFKNEVKGKTLLTAPDGKRYEVPNSDVKKLKTKGWN